MRSKIILTLLLLPLFSSSQSLTIDSVSDSSGTTCDTINESFHFKLSGSSSGLASGDSIRINVDHDDGSGFVQVDRVSVGGAGNFSTSWTRSWSNRGQKILRFTANGPSGTTDTVQKAKVIFDTCSVRIEKVTDSSGYATCDTVGEDIHFRLEGKSHGFSKDTFQLYADHDDGSGIVHVTDLVTYSKGYYEASWSHSWASSGMKQLSFIVETPTGLTDTFQQNRVIEDSCSSVTIDSFRDSSGASGCDTTGEDIHHLLKGSSSGLSTGDSIEIRLFPDSSGASTFYRTVNSNGDFSLDHVRSWPNAGTKELKAIVTGPMGNSDTSHFFLRISDSCGIALNSIKDQDTSSAADCYKTGLNIIQTVQGGTSGYSKGDSITLKVDHDDGNGFATTQDVKLGLYGSYSYTWDNSWANSGTKLVTVVAIGPNGETDTIQNPLVISDSCSTVQGRIYLDKNGNCTYDNGEPKLSYMDVKVTENNSLVGYGSSNKNGIYRVSVGSSISSLEVTLLDSGRYKLSCPSSGVIQLSNTPASGVDFGLSCPQNPDFSVNDGHVYGFRPGWKSRLYMELDGPSSCNDSLSCVKAVLPQELTPGQADSTEPAYSKVKGDTVIWNMDSLDVEDFDHGGLPLWTDSNATVGDTLCVELFLCASSDADPSNNSKTICEEVVNSWDPNNKRVLPRGNGPSNKIAAEQRMRYTINFQNTGTAPAIDIVVKDTLDSKVFDLNSFRMENSSHQVDAIKVQEDSIFSFEFMNIMLPDSGKSQAKSKGFIRFSIDQESGLEGGTEIRNNAAIFFDQNPPVITNSVRNTVNEPSSLNEPEEEDALRVYPNPARDRMKIRSGKKLEGKALLYDMTGRKVLEQALNGRRHRLDLRGVSEGVHLLEVRRKGEEKSLRKKVLIR